MKFTNPYIRTFLTVLPLFLLLAVAACDSDNNMIVPDSEAQEPEPELAEDEFQACPCFNENDVIGMADASTSVECATTVFGIALIPDNAPAITAECMNDGSMCMCSKGPGTTMINQDQYKSCISNIVNGIIKYNIPDIKTVGCD